MCGTKSGFELRLRPMTLPAARQHPLPVTEIVDGKLHGMPPRDKGHRKYLPPEQHAVLPASAAVTAVTGYSSIAHYFLDGRFARHGLELGLSWSCRFTHRVAPWQVLTRRVAVAGRGASMIRLFGGLTTEQKYPVLLEYAKASFERIKQRLRHL